MSLSQLDIIRHQAEAAARNQVSGTRARLRRETSLVGKASQYGAEFSRQGEALLRQRKRRPQDQDAPELRPVKNGGTPPAEDGYQRRSPVQPVMVPRDYLRRIVLRAVRYAMLAALVLAGVWVLLQSGLLAF